MKLLGVKKDGDWLYSEWTLTYRVGWDSICKAASLVYRYTEDPEIFVGSGGTGEKKAMVASAEEVMDIEENGYLTIRGVSGIIRLPLVITVFNQSDLVRLSVFAKTDDEKLAEEFAEADYRNFNLSMCQFMDSVEIAMFE
ncbi:MAG: hypothetical protein ILO53_08735 [Clostridia bacterium]|nr:hypothetical protein [Clostridia bacterium]